MARLRLDIAYDGTDFKGWAAQPGLRTVQGEIEAALTTLLRRTEPVRVTVGGRTDAGVHARGQVAHCDVPDLQLPQLLGRAATVGAQPVPGRDSARRLNGVLRRRGAADVLIKQITETVPEFDARFGALWRRYEYRVAGPGAVDPLARRTTAEIKRPIDFALLSEAAASLVGLRDFGAFCKPREGATTVRRLSEFSWRQEATVCVATIKADAFCHSMVRALVGATVAVATGRITLERLAAITAAAQRSSEFTVLPAHGLSLEEIAYPPESELAVRQQQTRAKREPFALSCDG